MQLNQRDVENLLAEARRRGVSNPRNLGMVSEHCASHGPFIVQHEVTFGSWQVVNPNGCPHCLAGRIASSLMTDGNMPERFAHCSFGNFEAVGAKQLRVLEVCRDYAENFAQHRRLGRCLIMCGNPGTGKNHLATAIFKKIRANRFTALRVKASEFLDAFWAKEFAERDDWLRGMFRVDLLIVDEVEKCSKGEPAKNAMFRLIDGRYESMSPTLVITNQARAELIETLGEPAFDRLTENGAQRLVFDWESRRATTNRGEA